MLAVLAGGPAAAQQPTGVRPAAVYGTPYPTTAGQPGGVPGGGFARPGMTFPQPPGQQPRTQQPAAAPIGTTGRPANGLPAGYRPVSEGPQQPAPRSERVGAAGGSGQVMYFHKPADALAVDGAADAGAVAQVSAPPVLAPAATDVAAPPLPGFAPPPLPPAVPDRAIGVPPSLAVPTAVLQDKATPQPPPVDPPAVAQPAPKVVDGPGALPPEVTQVPPRDKIFLMYDDATLQRVIIDRAKEDAKRRQKEAGLGGNWDFPALAPVVPPGTQYVSRTGTMPPAKVVYEPGFVVHRRLHFEEKNSERYGWDLGFVTPLVSTAHFYKDVLLWPNSLASGVVTGFWDTSAGKCLPGSPTPYYLYPPGLTLTGTAVEGLVITGAAFVIP